MARDSFKVKKSLNLDPTASPTLTEQGDIAVDSATGKASYHNGSTASPVVTEAHTATLTNKTIDAASNTVSNIADANVKAAAGIAVNKLAAQTPSKALTSDGSGFIAPSATTATELGYVSGVTSAIQTQLNGKQATGNYVTALTGDVVAAGPGSVAATIQANVVTNAKAAQMAANTIKGNNTGGLANAADLSVAQVQTMLGTSGINTGDQTITLSGAVSGSGTGAITTTLATVAPTKGGTGLTTYAAGDVLYASATNVLSALPKSTDGKVLGLASGLPAWITATATGGGSKNYLANPSFETDTSSWSLLTTTLTSGIPTGAVTLSASSLNALARTTSNPLAGVGSLQVSSPAAVSAGQGFISAAFAIDRKDEGKILTFAVPYEVVSGSGNMDFSGTSTQSFAVYIYDVTASAWIQPTGFRGMNQSKNPGLITGTFQTSVVAGQQYQLAVLAINATGGAVTINFDEMSVGPQTIITGTPASDPVAYTPVTAGIGTPTSINFTYARWANGIWIEGDLVTGTVTASELQIGLPSGMTTASDYAPLQSVGQAFVGFSASAGASETFNVLAKPSVTYLNFNKGVTTTLTAANGNDISTTATHITFRAFVRIAGFSSNVQLSQDTDTRVCVASYSCSAASQSPGVGGQINADNKLIDTHNAVTTGAGAWKFTAPITGNYLVTTSVSANGASNILLYKNNSAYALFAGVLNTIEGSGSIPIALNAGDFIDLRLSANVPIFGGSGATNQTQINIMRLTGPSVIAASEAVNASYVTTAGGAVAVSTTTFIDFGTKEWDSHGAVVGAGGGNTTTVQTGWRYVVQTPGKYRVTSQITYASQSGGAANLNFYVYQNASVKANAYVLSTTSVASYGCNFGRTLNCLAGDTIQIAVNQNAGASTLNTGVGTNYVNIELVK